MAVIRYKTEREVVAVLKQEAKDGVTSEGFALVEMDGHSRDGYLQTLSGRMRSKGRGLGNFRGIQSDLICRCLYPATINPQEDGNASVVQTICGIPVSQFLAEEEEGEDHETVPEKTVQHWPASFQQALFEEATRICGLKEDDEGSEGN